MNITFRHLLNHSSGIPDYYRFAQLFDGFTNTDVLDARSSLSRAEANHTQALFDYNIALAALQRAVGATVVERPDFKGEEPVK